MWIGLGLGGRRSLRRPMRGLVEKAFVRKGDGQDVTRLDEISSWRGRRKWQRDSRG